MAYGNWGAFVYRNGERMRQWEDNTPYRESDLPSGYWQAFVQPDKNIGTHHAVLGEKRVRLCGYKCYPVLFIDGARIDEGQYADGIIVLDGERYKFSIDRDDNMVDLELTEPDGTEWTARCGYEYGAGHMD